MLYSFDADKKLRNLDILHNIASDPEGWCSRDSDLRSRQKSQVEGSSGSGSNTVVPVEWDTDSSTWVDASSSITFTETGSGFGGLGDLPLFLQHVSLMRELDDLKDKVPL